MTKKKKHKAMKPGDQIRSDLIAAGIITPGAAAVEVERFECRGCGNLIERSKDNAWDTHCGHPDCLFLAIRNHRWQAADEREAALNAKVA
jgi:hypothetical protein